LIQQYCNPKAISSELELILNDESYRSQMLHNYEELNQHLGGAGASARFAKMIYEDIKRD
jgi:lipid-A-disaccharide synthase